MKHQACPMTQLLFVKRHPKYGILEVIFIPPVTEIDMIECMFNTNSIANGTPQSVHLWAKNAFPHCSLVQRAFEVLTAKFVLVYCMEADGMLDLSDLYSDVVQQKYISYVQLLHEMVGNLTDSRQLITLLCGPSGSGKTRIIDELVKYGQIFCANIDQPFTKDTICVTAYTSITAAQLSGRTIQSTLF